MALKSSADLSFLNGQWFKIVSLGIAAVVIAWLLSINNIGIDKVSDIVWVALIAVASPLMLAWMTSRERRSEKEEDWKREDAVAALAARAAQDLRIENTKVRAAALAAQTAAEQTHAQLSVIHKLVNSNLTAAMKEGLEATVDKLAYMEEIVDLKTKMGEGPIPVAQTAILMTRKKIAAMQGALTDREAAAAQIAYGEGIPVVPPDEIQKT